MFCPACGAENEDTAGFCSQCGKPLPHAEPSSSQGGPAPPDRQGPPAPPQRQGPPAPPQRQPAGARPGDVPNYLVQAILVTIFCCLPFGIVAIVFAAQVNGKLERGDHEGALRASKTAKLWSWVSFGVGLGLVGLWVLLVIIGAMFG